MYYSCFTPACPGEMIQFDVRIFFNWVGSTHQLLEMKKSYHQAAQKAKKKGEEGEGMKEGNFPSLHSLKLTAFCHHANRPFQNETGIPTIHFQDLLAC